MINAQPSLNETSPNSAPLVSIVMPVYNRENLVAETIDSVMSQTYGNWELIAVDDGSEDNTISVIQSYKSDKIRIYSLPHTGKIANVRNTGMKLAMGKYIAVLDSDDLWREDKLAIQIDCFQSDSNIKYIISSGEQFGINPVNIPVFESNTGNLFELLVIEQKYPLLTSSLVYDVNALEDVGYLNEDWEGVIDVDYIYRLAFCYSGAYIGEKLVRYRKHEDCHHLANENAWKEMMEMYGSLCKSGMLAESQAEILSNNILKKYTR